MKPIAVLISDVHFNISTIKEASKSVLQAGDKASELRVPFVIAGDLHDTKANMRAECVNAMLKTIRGAYILVGNHDKINEKSIEHSLNFLENDFNTIVEQPMILWNISGKNVWLVPYYHDVNALKTWINAAAKKGDILIMHQGINGSNSGEYIQDRTALNKEDLAGFRVISGHYHQRQTIDLPDGGKWDYIGNPFTLGFGEANDPEKGFQVLYDDGSLEFVPTNIRKHIIISDNLATGEYNWSSGPGHYTSDRKDIFWVKITGSSDQLSTFDKKQWAKDRGVPGDFRLDLIPTETVVETTTTEPKSQLELFDSAIDGLSNTSDDRKERLKQLYKDLLT